MSAKRLMIFLTAVLSIVAMKRFMFHSTQSTNNSSFLHNIATPQDAPIPKEALRLRVIANSDSAADQTLKLQVRNAVVLKVGQLLHGAKTPDEAREILMKEIPTLQQVALQVVHAHGNPYGVQTEVAKVPFPTKVYGNQVYPAGNYEALRIVLGAGKGANWWCVLFPPLCFVDIAEGDAVPNTGGFPDLPPLETVQVPGPNGNPTKVQVRLASLDYGEELWQTVKNMFSSGSSTVS